MRLQQIKLPPQKVDVIPLVGGLDTVTTPILLRPGMLMASSNYEPDTNGGYRRIGGYERFDGRSRPSDANYYMAVVTTSGTFSVGNTITGASSGATAVIIAVVSSTSLVLTKYTGTFTGGETLNVGGNPQGTITSITTNSASTSLLHASYKNLAADQYRSDIQKPTGSGAIRGVWFYNGDVYCFRDNAGATACDMWKETTSGWTKINFGREIQFTNAVGQISDGDTVTGLTSGASAVCKRALLRTGTWTASGVGTLVFDSVTGAFQNGESLQVGGVTKATSSSVDTAITLAAGGKFEFDNINFTGTTSTLRMYFADGANYIHEFDGTRIVPIRTGIGNDKPKFIKGHKNQLFCAIESSVQVSGIGSPYSWTALTGSAEIGLGETVTGLLPQTGDATTGALVITTSSKVYILYGNNTSDFNLVLHSPNTGAKAYTLQNIGFAHFLDTRGITQLQTTQAFGGFNMSIMTNLVQPIIDAKKGLEKSSFVVRGKDQYRLHFSDGTAIIMQVAPSQTGTSPAAFMFLDYGSSMYFNQVCSFVDTDGTERIMAAGSDGYVYEVDVGTSFDGSNIASHFMTTFTTEKAPRYRKRYKRTVLQFKAGNTARVSVGYDLAYGNLDPSYGSATSISTALTQTTIGAGGYWDSFDWDSFSWDASYMQEINVSTPGTGDSMAIIVTGDTDEDEPYTIHTAFVYYMDGRLNR